jgi:hypothetical protein
LTKRFAGKACITPLKRHNNPAVQAAGHPDIDEIRAQPIREVTLSEIVVKHVVTKRRPKSERYPSPLISPQLARWCRHEHTVGRVVQPRIEHDNDFTLNTECSLRP